MFILTCICICSDIRDSLYNDPVDCEEVTKCVPVSGHAGGFVSATSASCFVFAKNLEPPPVSCLVLATPMNELTSVTPLQQRHYTGIALFRNERKFLDTIIRAEGQYLRLSMSFSCVSIMAGMVQRGSWRIPISIYVASKMGREGAGDGLRKTRKTSVTISTASSCARLLSMWVQEEVAVPG